MSRYDRYRQLITRQLDQAEGAHYLHGSFGNHPGASNGHPARYTRLTMPSNNYGDTPAHNPGPVHVHAARCNSNVVMYCCGRPDTAPTRTRVPQQHLATPDALRQFVAITEPQSYLWPRPDSEHPGQQTFGESCENKRHFDCIGLVNWVMWSIFLTPTINDIVQCKAAGLAQAARHPELAATIEPGDILVFNITHVGIAADANRMIEAKGAHWGVTRSNIDRSKISAKLRPTDEILRGRWNVHG